MANAGLIMAMTQRFSDCPPHGNFPPGKASDYIRHACKEIKWGDKVVIWCRVSHHTQDHNGNLNDQEQNLRDELTRMGAIVCDIVREVGPGWRGDGLNRAAAIARKHGAKLVAESTCRLIRPFDYHSSKNPDAQAREHDLLCLKARTEGVVLVTLLHPDASPAEERAYQTRRGQEAKGRKGGRPAKQPPGYTIDRFREMLPIVLRLREGGATIRKIAEETGVPRSTVCDWLGM
jgi:Homeodomain-like domain